MHRKPRTTLRYPTLRLGAACLLIGTACSPATETIRHTYDNEGLACLVAAGVDAGSPIGPADDLSIYVRIDECASPCATVEAAECEALVDGSVIRVSTHAEVVAHVKEGDVCSAACAVVDATCPLGPLAAGSYEIQLGGVSRTVELPGTDARCDPNYVAE